MKRRNKVILIALGVLLVAGGGVLLWRPAPRPAPPADDDLFLPDEDLPGVPHYAIATSGAEAPDGTLQAPDLSGQLKRAAIRTVLATLPEGSAVQGKVELRLTGAKEAQVTGTALTPPGAETPERRYRFQIKLNFLPGGDAECAFPEFTELNHP